MAFTVQKKRKITRLPLSAEVLFNGVRMTEVRQYLVYYTRNNTLFS